MTPKREDCHTPPPRLKWLPNSQITPAGLAGNPVETPITEAKNTFTALVHQVESGEVVHLTRHGRPVAVLLSEADYQNLRQSAVTRGDLLDFVQSWRDTLPGDWRGISEREIAATRDLATAREPAWEV